MPSSVALVLLLAGCTGPQHEGSFGPASSQSPPDVAPSLRRDASSGLAYAWIEPGTYLTGCAREDDECRDDEKPRRRVTLERGFWMATTEVTREAYGRFVADTGHLTAAERRGAGGVLGLDGWENVEGATWRAPGFLQTDSHPVVLVAWSDAVSLCEWAGGRLPTELEWERAARGGLENARYVWGDEPVPLVHGRRHANAADAAASGVSVPAHPTSYDDGWPHTAPVGTFAANGHGLFDMAGNVVEWCADDTGDDRRVARGGSWNNPAQLLRVTRRSRFPADAALSILGFRCARDDPFLRSP